MNLMNTHGPLLDLAVAGLYGWMSACLFALFIITGKGPKVWLTLPGYIRWAFIYTGWLMMVRSVNLISLHSAVEPVAGRANLEAFAVNAGVAYIVTAVTVFIARQRLSGGLWDRLFMVKRSLHDHPSQIPVSLELEDVAHVARGRGMVAIAPKEGAAALVREVEARRL